jgi:hypothetical protein
MLTQKESLTDAESQLAHNLAMALVKDETDVNELGKAIAYLRSIVNQQDAGVRFFKYLKTLVSNGRQIGHSKKTSDYYYSIQAACNKFLQGEKANAENILKILGWAMRLMRYYKVSPIEDFSLPNAVAMAPEISQRQAEIAEVSQSQKFEVDQVLDASVLSIKGNKVTYQILEVIKLTEKEPKKAASLKEGQVVKVKIVAIKDDGSIKSVKCTE